MALIAGLSGAAIGLMLVLGAVAYKVRVVRRPKVGSLDRKVDIRLHGKGNSNSHGARPVY